jgi:hypothetical protein
VLVNGLGVTLKAAAEPKLKEGITLKLLEGRIDTCDTVAFDQYGRLFGSTRNGDIFVMDKMTVDATHQVRRFAL